MEKKPQQRYLPEITEHEEVGEADMVYEEPPLPFPNRAGSDGVESGELLAAGWPVGEGLYRLNSLLEKYPVLAQISDLPRAIDLLKEVDKIVKSLPTQSYPELRSIRSTQEALEVIAELRERLDSARG